MNKDCINHQLGFLHCHTSIPFHHSLVSRCLPHSIHFMRRWVTVHSTHWCWIVMCFFWVITIQIVQLMPNWTCSFLLTFQMFSASCDCWFNSTCFQLIVSHTSWYLCWSFWSYFPLWSSIVLWFISSSYHLRLSFVML